jgi:hypothetical protein
MIRFISLASVVLVALPALAEPQQEAYLTHNSISPFKNGLSAPNVQFGFVDLYDENFGLVYEYGYWRPDDFKNEREKLILDNIEITNRRLKYSIHTLMIAGQQKFAYHLHLWGGIVGALASGDIACKDGPEINQTANFKGTMLLSQVGIGQLWPLTEDVSLGIDWLTVAINVQKQIQLDSPTRDVVFQRYKAEWEHQIDDSLSNFLSVRVFSLRVQMVL